MASPAAPSGISAQDYANVALGAMVAVGTFMVGKIVVESVIKLREERFQRRGQPRAAVKSRETTADGVVKLLGVTFTIWQISQDFPQVAAEVKRYLP